MYYDFVDIRVSQHESQRNRSTNRATNDTKSLMNRLRMTLLTLFLLSRRKQ